MKSRTHRGRIGWSVVALGVVLCGAVVAVPAAQAATPACQVAYTVTNSWTGGFQSSITITNNAAPISAWTLGFALPGTEQVSSGWDGTWSQSGQNVTVQSLNWNGSLATGGSTTIGFVGNGADAAPTAFTLNGVACNGATAPSGPTVSITSPTQGQSFTAPATVTIGATAAESGGTISKVEFFDGATLLGTSTTAPYTDTWSGVAAGSYSLTATAFDATGATATSAAVSITVTSGGGGTPGAAPQLHVSGNQLVDATGRTVVLHGVDRSGGEFSCVQGTGIWDGPMDQASVTAIRSWDVTAVRVPLNEACWNGESYVNAAYAGTTYRQAVQQYVNLLNSNGIVAILDLHWTDGTYTGNSAGCSSAQATCQKPMPDAAGAIPFWTSVASMFKGDNAVVFDLFNEPYVDRATGDETSAWVCWRDGGTCPGVSYQVAGMQSMVNAVRSTGASNVLMLGGLAYSNDLTQWLAYEPSDPDGNLAASWHSYNFNSCANQSCWSSQIAPVIAKVPLIAGEIGENDCAHGYIDSLTAWLDSQHSSYLAWTWNTWDCSSGPALITDYSGTPTAFGAGYQAHLRALG